MALLAATLESYPVLCEDAPGGVLAAGARAGGAWPGPRKGGTWNKGGVGARTKDGAGTGGGTAPHFVGTPVTDAN